jgi:hypothetical protein
LGRSSRFESLHLALSSSHRLMRILGAIILAEPLLMTAGQLQLPERGAVGAQFVSYQQFGHKSLLSEKLAHQPQRCPAVATTLGQHVEDLAFVTPEIHPLPGDPNNHLVQVPAIARAGAAAL